MRKRNVQKAVVLLVFLSFLGLSASGLMAGTTSTSGNTVKLSFSLLFRNPALFFSTLLPGLRGLFGQDNPGQTANQGQVTTVKPTGTIKSIRLSGGD